MQDWLSQSNNRELFGKENPNNDWLKTVVWNTAREATEVLESPVWQFKTIFSEIKDMDFPVYIDSKGWRVHIRARDIIYHNTKTKAIEIWRTKGEEIEPELILRLGESWDSFVYYAPGMHYLNPYEEISEEDSKAIESLLCAFRNHINEYKKYQNEKQTKPQWFLEFRKIIEELPKSPPEADEDGYDKGKYIVDEHGKIKLGIRASNFDGFSDYDEICLVIWFNKRISLCYNRMGGNFYLETSRYNEKYYKLNEEETQTVLKIIKNIDNCDVKKLFDDLPSGYWEDMRKNPSQW